ncbi:enoyl-CoA hydratase/isomerase family protein [Hyphomonas sp.]|uniref:enoyl-CoA hydratase/isomerase family protein n=1 Tax=Hyphomonas sp. TaxID=87 RepID=UPI003F6FDBB9
MTYETIILDISGHIATITLNRPDAMNSFTRKMMDECEHAWRHIAETDDIHCAVLRAAPGRAFSTGVDVKAAMQPGGSVMHDNIWTAEDPGEKLGPKSNRCWKPVICAVHGMAAGGAFYWINEADIVICSEDATFFDPHVTYGMTAALEPIGATYRMPLGDVLRMALLGNDERISAMTALRLGLVTEITPNEALWDRAQALAEIVAAKPPAATAGTVKAIWESLDMPRSVALRTALKYCQIGNPVGTSQVDRAALMGTKQGYTVR